MNQKKRRHYRKKKYTVLKVISIIFVLVIIAVASIAYVAYRNVESHLSLQLVKIILKIQLTLLF